MLYLLFQIGNDRYALEARQAVEVLPLLAMKTIPQAPRGVAGIFNFRGRPVPAIDLAALMLGQPARERLSTRIIVLQHTDAGGPARLLGLVAEHATEMIRREPREFVEPGIRTRSAPWLGPVLMDASGVIQLLHPQQLLSEKVRELLIATETVEA
jgi:chemotaxis-related protein WspB